MLATCVFDWEMIFMEKFVAGYSEGGKYWDILQGLQRKRIHMTDLSKIGSI